MSTRGIVSALCDPTDRAVIGDAWAASVTALGADALKVPIICAADGSMPTDLYEQGLVVAARHGLPVLGVFTRGFVPVGGETASVYSNMALATGAGANPLLSPYIEAVTLRAEGVARQLVRFGLTRFACGNEPNEHALLAQGVPVDAGSDKAGAMAPEVFAAYCWQMAHRLKAAGATEVYCGALSLLPQTGLDGANGYYAAYVRAFYEFLALHGHHAPFPFDGWLINTEGLWRPGAFAAAVGVLRGIMSAHGDHGAIIVGEWGITNAALPAQTAALGATYAQIAGAVNECYAFQHFGSVPYLGDTQAFGGYGAIQYRVMGPELVPGADYRLAPVLRSLFLPHP